MLFHHDPMHTDDFLDRFQADAGKRWAELGRSPADLTMAAGERDELRGAGPPPDPQVMNAMAAPSPASPLSVAILRPG